MCCELEEKLYLRHCDCEALHVALKLHERDRGQSYNSKAGGFEGLGGSCDSE